MKRFIGACLVLVPILCVLFGPITFAVLVNKDKAHASVPGTNIPPLPYDNKSDDYRDGYLQGQADYAETVKAMPPCNDGK